MLFRSGVLVADDATGCEPPPTRWPCSVRMQPSGATEPPDRREALGNRAGRCTTALRPELACPRLKGARSRDALGGGRSSRETVPALGAAVLQHFAASAGAHAGAETVLLGTAAVVGLVGALHATLLGRGGDHARTDRWTNNRISPWRGASTADQTTADRPQGHAPASGSASGALSRRRVRLERP